MMKNNVSVVKALTMGFSPSWTSVLLTIALSVSLGSELFASFRGPKIVGSGLAHATDGLPRAGSTVGRVVDGNDAGAGTHDPYVRLTDEARRLDATDGLPGSKPAPDVGWKPTSEAGVVDWLSRNLEPVGQRNDSTAPEPQVPSGVVRHQEGVVDGAQPVFRAASVPSGPVSPAAARGHLSTGTGHSSLLNRRSLSHESGLLRRPTDQQAVVRQKEQLRFVESVKERAKQAFPIVAKRTASLWKSSKHFLLRHFRSKEAMDLKFSEKIAKMQDLTHEQREQAVAQFKQGFIDTEIKSLPADVQAKIRKNLEKYRKEHANSSSNNDGLLFGRNGLVPKFLEFEIFENTVGVEVTGPLEAIGNILMNIVDGIGSLFD